MIGRHRARPRERALGFGAVSGLVGTVDRLHERPNLRFADSGCSHRLFHVGIGVGF